MHVHMPGTGQGTLSSMPSSWTYVMHVTPIGAALSVHVTQPQAGTSNKMPGALHTVGHMHLQLYV